MAGMSNEDKDILIGSLYANLRRRDEALIQMLQKQNKALMTRLKECWYKWRHICSQLGANLHNKGWLKLLYKLFLSKNVLFNLFNNVSVIYHFSPALERSEQNLEASCREIKTLKEDLCHKTESLKALQKQVKQWLSYVMFCGVGLI